ncbi:MULTISPECIES: amino acid permease [Edaphosphingomonas]|uniref:Arginine/agmatine antiporter n=2 Tax=Edaphosphingomonas TaxID=3423724 RepID=A0A2T4HT84_9SPHN|nr:MULTISPECIES: amino acid permease [Sphingomonas]MDX3884167.1 amino acid permease [Sphingomonas sp.]OHT22281.1 Arginine/agmatine antiporter [Sphingomonas haloaromaticamans]PTD19011.1 amino acid permease [Sphingomonas fennica]
MTSPPETAPSAGRSLGLIACSALVVGNVIGSGFFLSPAALAPYGYVALIGWVMMSAVAMCIALVFARLAGLLPGAGGPYAYARHAFGSFAGFIVAWAYWISMWVSQPAIALTFVGYLRVFLPDILGDPILSTLVALAALWGVALVNIHSVRAAGLFQSIVVAMKLLPFIAIGTIGLFWVDPSRLFLPIEVPADAAAGNFPVLSALAATMPLIMFAFLGIESSTVPADDVVDPARTIPRATMLGTLLCALIFIFCTVAVMGVVPREVLSVSSSPFADAASMMWGKWAGWTLAGAVVLSSLAALNGWTLVMAQVPLAAARDDLFPPVFARLNRNGVPSIGIVISIGLSSFVLCLQATGLSTLIGVYRELINLSTTAEMVPYVFCAAAEGVILGFAVRARGGRRRIRLFTFVSLIAFLFSLITIFGAGASAGLWTMVLMLLGLPIYAWALLRREAEGKPPL